MSFHKSVRQIFRNAYDATYKLLKTSLYASDGTAIGNVGDSLKVYAPPLPATAIDSNNSTTTPLAANATYTGTAVDIIGYSTITIIVYSDVDSVSDGMQFQFSQDGTNWDDVYKHTLNVLDSNSRRFQFPVVARYFRVVYINSFNIQNEFRVQTILHRENTLTSIDKVDSDVAPDRSSTLTKSVLVGYNEDGDRYENIYSTTNKELLVYAKINAEQMAKIYNLLTLMVRNGEYVKTLFNELMDEEE